MNILVFGTFDRLHPGHEYVLQEAAKRGELHVVVARDVTVETIKGHKPEQSQEERMAAIQKRFPDAHVILGDTDRYLKPVQAVAPGLILLGYDQKLPPGVSMEDLPCRVERLPAYKPERFKSSLRRS